MIPQDIPLPVVADVVRFVKSRHRVFDTPIGAPPDGGRGALADPQAHRAAVVVRDGRPVGVVSEADCVDVDRFAQVEQVMNPAPTVPRTRTLATFDALDAAHAPWPWRWTATGPGRGADPHGRARGTLYAPAVDAAAACASRPRSG